MGISLLRSAHCSVLTTSACLGRPTPRALVPSACSPARHASLFVPFPISVASSLQLLWIVREQCGGFCCSPSSHQEHLKSGYASTVVLFRAWRWTPSGVEVGCKVSSRSHGPLFCMFVLISEYPMYASTSSTCHGPPRGRAAAFRVWSRMLRALSRLLCLRRRRPRLTCVSHVSKEKGLTPARVNCVSGVLVRSRLVCLVFFSLLGNTRRLHP